jgi:hypothetical protein
MDGFVWDVASFGSWGLYLGVGSPRDLDKGTTFFGEGVTGRPSGRSGAKWRVGDHFLRGAGSEVGQVVEVARSGVWVLESSMSCHECSQARSGSLPNRSWPQRKQELELAH